MVDEQTGGNKPRKMTAKRQAILAGAFAQLRLSKKKIDPQILEKIRNMVKSSPALMKTLGFKSEGKVDEDMPLSSKQPQTVENKPASQDQKEQKLGSEKIDQAKNMEVMAKLMELSPDNREAIKKVIKKSQD